jgi:hypothetical protein
MRTTAFGSFGYWATLLATGLASLASLASMGCGGPGVHSREAGAVSPLAVRSVAWNASQTRIGKVRAVTDAGDVSAVFADDGAYVFTAGALVAADRSVTDWVDADTIFGPDGSARWIIGVNARGRVYHLRGRSSFEEVSERYGLGDRQVRGAAVLGTGAVGFLLDGEVALADGMKVTRYGIPRLLEIAGGGGYGAGVASDRVFVFGAAQRTLRSYDLPRATAATLGPDGRLYATTPRAVYASSPSGELDLVLETSGDSIHGLVASGEHVWFADGTELGVVDGARVAETSGAHIAEDAKLRASTTGDVWVLAQGALSRYARVDPEPDLQRAWNDKLSGVFARSCAACHMPNGPSGVDLSSAEAWQTRRALIKDRVVVTHTMPPQGRALTDADRDAIKGWAEGASR